MRDRVQDGKRAGEGRADLARLGGPCRRVDPLRLAILKRAAREQMIILAMDDRMMLASSSISLTPEREAIRTGVQRPDVLPEDARQHVDTLIHEVKVVPRLAASPRRAPDWGG